MQVNPDLILLYKYSNHLKPGMRLSMNHFRKLFPLILSLSFSLSSINCSSNKTETVERAIPVQLAEVRYEKRSLPIERSGILAAKTESKLAFKAGGILEDIRVEEGQTVRKDQLLASLALNEMQAYVDQARGGYEKAQRDLERVIRLWHDKVTTLEQKQDAETGFQIARANLNIAEFNLKHARIYAPANGKILKRFAEKNELVSAGMPIFYFSSTSSKWVMRLGVADIEIVQIQKGDSAAIFLEAYPALRLSGAVSELAETIDPRSGTFEVEVELLDFPPKLISGFVGRVKIFPAADHHFYIIPIDALMEAEDKHGYIFILLPAGNRVQKIPVTIDHFTDDYAAISPSSLSSDLQKISSVIMAGSAYLSDGALVKVITQ
jgi:multidrug efflux system membrane fusion protein